MKGPAHVQIEDKDIYVYIIYNIYILMMNTTRLPDASAPGPHNAWSTMKTCAKIQEAAVSSRARAAKGWAKPDTWALFITVKQDFSMALCRTNCDIIMQFAHIMKKNNDNKQRLTAEPRWENSRHKSYQLRLALLCLFEPWTMPPSIF